MNKQYYKVKKLRVIMASGEHHDFGVCKYKVEGKSLYILVGDEEIYRYPEAMFLRVEV
jgi:hypothetical protein